MRLREHSRWGSAVASSDPAGNRRVRAGFRGLAAFLLAGAATSCHGPKVESAWSRLGADATVVFSSPVQVPAMAVRDAVFFSDDPWENTVAFPLTLPAFLVWHTSLAALHLVDLGAAPLHFLDERGPPRIYQPYAFPMPYHEDAAIGEEAGQMLLYGVGFVGGAVGAYYFATEYLPRALKVPGS